MKISYKISLRKPVHLSLPFTCCDVLGTLLVCAVQSQRAFWFLRAQAFDAVLSKLPGSRTISPTDFLPFVVPVLYGCSSASRRS